MDSPNLEFANIFTEQTSTPGAMIMFVIGESPEISERLLIAASKDLNNKNIAS